MKIYTFLILFVVALSSCAQNTTKDAESTAQGPAVKNLTQEEFKKNYENKEGLQLLDVRTAEEISVGKIGTALELDVFDPNFAEKVAKLDLDKSLPVVVYCRSGGRSLKASNIMIEQGYTQVYNLLGGFSNYKKNY